MEAAGRRFFDTALSLKNYYQTLSSVLKTPGVFFSGLPDRMSPVPPLLFLTVSALLGAAGSLTQNYPNPWSWAVNFVLFSGLCLTLVTAGITYVIMTPLTARTARFSCILAIYAYSTGALMLLSWITVFSLLAEMGKWILIGVGISRKYKLKWPMTLMVIALSLTVLYGFMWAVAWGLAAIRSGMA